MAQIIKKLHCPECNGTVITRTENITTVHEVSIVEIDGEPELELELVDSEHEDEDNIMYECIGCGFQSKDITRFGFPEDPKTD